MYFEVSERANEPAHLIEIATPLAHAGNVEVDLAIVIEVQHDLIHIKLLDLGQRIEDDGVVSGVAGVERVVNVLKFIPLLHPYEINVRVGVCKSHCATLNVDHQHLTHVWNSICATSQTCLANT